MLKVLILRKSFNSLPSRTELCFNWILQDTFGGCSQDCLYHHPWILLSRQTKAFQRCGTPVLTSTTSWAGLQNTVWFHLGGFSSHWLDCNAKFGWWSRLEIHIQPRTRSSRRSTSPKGYWHVLQQYSVHYGNGDESMFKYVSMFLRLYIRHLCSLIRFHQLTTERVNFPISGGWFPVTIWDCPVKCGHKDYDHNKGTGPHFFIIVTGAEMLICWLPMDPISTFTWQQMQLKWWWMSCNLNSASSASSFTDTGCCIRLYFLLIVVSRSLMTHYSPFLCLPFSYVTAISGGWWAELSKFDKWICH